MTRLALAALALALALPAAAQQAEALRAQSEAYTRGMAHLIGRQGDVMVFCHEGGDGGWQSQGWRPINPAQGTYQITRWCSGAPCPNWSTLRAYQQICPQALGAGPWTGPGGPGQAGMYQSSGGSQYIGDVDNPSGLQPHHH